MYIEAFNTAKALLDEISKLEDTRIKANWFYNKIEYNMSLSRYVPSLRLSCCDTSIDLKGDFALTILRQINSLYEEEMKKKQLEFDQL